VNKRGPIGIFAKAKFSKRDVILNIDGHVTNSITDCKQALTKISGGRLVTLLTYNVFRKARSSLFVVASSRSARHEDQRKWSHAEGQFVITMSWFHSIYPKKGTLKKG
jgi:hypothetical protein